MKNKMLVLAGIVSILTIFGISMALHTQAGTVFPTSEANIDSSVEFTLETSFPELESTFPVLETKSPVVSSEYVEEIGQRYGFTGEAGPAGTGKIGMLSEDGTEHLIVYEKSGAIFYSVPEKMSPVVSSQPDLPSDAEAIKIAESFLAEMNLLPSDAKLDKVVADKQLESEKSTGKVLKEYDTVLQVIASAREINGIPIVGPGNKIKVYVGEKGEVVGLFKAWKDVETSKEKVNIKTAETAYTELQNGKAMFLTANLDTIDKVSIKNIYLAYWMEPAGEEQDSALPVYVFEGEAIDSESQAVPFTAYVPATFDGTAF
ncbi:MAG: hypothetical protein AB9861_16945 [Methanosarcina sp.]